MSMNGIILFCKNIPNGIFSSATLRCVYLTKQTLIFRFLTSLPTRAIQTIDSPSLKAILRDLVIPTSHTPRRARGLIAIFICYESLTGLIETPPPVI